MSELQRLDEFVPRVDEDGDWMDVLRRARPRRRRAVAVAAFVAAVVAGTALAVVLTREAKATLPPQADRSSVVVIVEPLTGRVVVQAAPWKGHEGMCYVILFTRAGCAARSTRGTVVLSPPLGGYTFDRRVVSGAALTLSGRRVPLLVRRFAGRVDATFFVTRGRLPRLVRAVILRDRAGRVVARVSFKKRR